MSGIVGEQEAKKADFPARLLSMRIAKETTAQDTKTAVDLLAASDVDLIVFVGGDGTARDILARATPIVFRVCSIVSLRRQAPFFFS